MEEKETKNVPEIFKAAPADERKTVVVSREQRILRPNQIPEKLIKNEFLNNLVDSSLPKNYNFEIHKTIWKIQQTNSKRVLLQLPEGLIRFGPVIVDILNAYFDQNGSQDIRIIVMGDLTYGACCIDDYLAKSMGCDLVVHYAHSCLVPINQLGSEVKYLYVFLDIKFDMEHMIECIKHNFDPTSHNIAIASTIQFVTSVHEIARRLRLLNFEVTLPQSKPLSYGEVLGCTAPKLDLSINTIVFICDGRFHLEALMIANPGIDAFRYDPYTRKLTRESYEFDQMYGQRMQAVTAAVNVMTRGGTFGFVLGTLGRQGNEKVYDKMIERLRDHTKCKVVKVLMPEVTQDILKTFESIDVWVQIACPRLSIDWGSFFRAPLLNPYEFAQGIKLFLKGQSGDNEVKERSYPMDFYAKKSCHEFTPNHSCQGNTHCQCQAFN